MRRWTPAVVLATVLAAWQLLTAHAFTATTRVDSRGATASTLFTVPTTRRSFPTVQQQQQQQQQRGIRVPSILASTATANNDASPSIDPTLPQVWSAGYSTQADLVQALKEAVAMAVASLPPINDNASTGTRADNKIDICIVSISSLYDGGAHSPTQTVIPVVTETAAALYAPIQHLVGSSCAGVLSSSSVPAAAASSSSSPNTGGPVASIRTQCRAVEWEGLPAVSVTLGILPDTVATTFHCVAADVPDDCSQITSTEWKRAVGLGQFPHNADLQAAGGHAPVVWMLPGPSFSTELDDFSAGLRNFYPAAQIGGGLASTVSSLSRAVLYRYSVGGGSTVTADGCVGWAVAGDVQLQTLTAQGAKPVGGIYQILKGEKSTIQAIVLDETATEALKDDNDEEEEEEEEEEGDDDDPAVRKARMAQVYAKARIPKPVLAEANFLMRTLSDDDQAFMRRQLLVGLEQGGSVGRTASELVRLARGEGHRFTVYQVASAGMKDGSVTLPVGRVNIQPGTRMRFFVRESDFAKKEVEALWVGYKKRILAEQFASDKPSFTPSAVFVIPTLDRGSKFFNGKSGYESSVVSSMIPGLPCISGFFSNGVVGRIDGGTDSEEAMDTKTGIHGSASGYFLIGSKSGRPIYSPAKAAAKESALEEQKAEEAAETEALAAEDEKRANRLKSPAESGKPAPRSEDGELILKRRDVHSARSLSVSTVEWSVAEKTATPSSTLEGFMWDKETEVDRFRERVPLANLVSQCRLSVADPNAPKPRDWVGPLKQAAVDGRFVIVPECKRMEPASGSLRRRYDLPKLIRDFTLAGAPAISVNCDAVLFGGSLEDIIKAREASSSASIEQMSEDGVVVPAILASDLLLYPYQLYKLQLAGADAVNLIGGALAAKDLMYLTKIAASLKFQTLVTVTSEVQLRALAALAPGNIDGVIVSNRQLEVKTMHCVFLEIARIAISFDSI